MGQNSALGAINRQVRHEEHFAPCCFQIKRGRRRTWESYIFAPPLIVEQIFRPFHVLSYLAASSPGIIWRFSERRTTSGLFSSELPLTGEPLLTRTLGFKRRTSDQMCTCAHCSHGHIHLEAAETPSPMRKCRQMKAPASSSVEN